MMKHPKELGNNHKFRELSRSQQQTELWRKLRFLQLHYNHLFVNEQLFNFPYVSFFDHFQGPAPTGLNYTMF